jgi:hypothetical protein
LHAFLDRFRHLIGHGFDLLVLMHGSLYPVGFEMGVETLHMILNKVRPMLIRIMRTACEG